MEIRQLRYFAEVCQARSFTVAATRVGVSQPALSQSIKDLERQLDTVLLDRRTGGTYPTPEGEALLEFANAIVRQHDGAIVELDRIKAGRNGQVKLGVHSTFPRRLSIKAIERFREHYPQVEVRLISTASLRGEAEGRLAANEWDAALLPYQVGTEYSVDKEWKSRFRMQPIINTDSHVYAKKGHPLTFLKTLSCDDLLAYPWVLGSVGTAKNLSDLLRASGATGQFNCGLIADDFEAILEATVRTEMLCVAPEQLAKESGQPLVRLNQNIIPSLPFTWGVMTSLSLALTKPVRYLISCLTPQ